MEFSLVVGLVLLLLLGAVQVGLYAIERGASCFALDDPDSLAAALAATAGAPHA